MSLPPCSTCDQPLCTCLRPHGLCQCPAPVCDCSSEADIVWAIFPDRPDPGGDGPQPPALDTLGRVVQLQRDREAVLVWLASIPQQHDPTVAAWVAAQMAEVRTADEATIQALMDRMGIARPRQRRAKLPPGEFWGRYATLRAERLARDGRYPTDTEAADALGISRRTIYRYLHPDRGQKKNRRKS